jgi:hypothetical protein
MAEEGWCTDPFGVHAHRWFSDGTPTALVRDQGRTSEDPPPDAPYVDAPHLVEPTPAVEDGLRCGDARDDNAVDPVDAAWTYFTRSGSGF